jgi:DNA-directed RNA polymerase
MVIGGFLLRLCVEYGGFCERKLVVKKVGDRIKDRQSKYSFLPEIEVWMEKCHHYLMNRCAKALPMIVPPVSRTSMCRGGYLTDILFKSKLISKTPGVITSDFYENKDFPRVYQAINHLQNTAFKVNTRVLDTMNTIWDAGGGLVGLPKNGPLELPPNPYSKSEWAQLKKTNFTLWKERMGFVADLHQEHIRKRSLVTSVSNCLTIANKFRDQSEIFFPYNLDFRGRINCVPQHLSPQGFECSKGLLEFSRKEELTDDAVYWLKLQAAKTY